MSACLPVPDDCCQECGCNDEAIIVVVPGGGGAGIHVDTVNSPDPMPAIYVGWYNQLNGGLWFRDPITGAALMVIAPTP